MRKKYEDPLFDVVKFQISNELLGPSTFTPEDEIKEEVINDDP